MEDGEPSLRRGRQAAQWGQDFSQAGATATMLTPMEISHDEQEKWASDWVPCAPQKEGAGSRNGVATVFSPPHHELLKPAAALGLSIDTSPPGLETVVEGERPKVERKRDTHPVASPNTEQASLAQKKKRPAPLVLAETKPAYGQGI